MAINQSWAWYKLRQKMCLALIGPHALAFFPAGALGVYWVGGEIALIGTAAAMPLIFLALGGFSASQHDTGLSRDGYAGLLGVIFSTVWSIKSLRKRKIGAVDQRCFTFASTTMLP